MYTTHSLTAPRSISRGCACRVCVCRRGHVCWGACMHKGDVHVWGGVHAQGGMHATHAPLSVNRMTDVCENITLPQTSFAGGKYQLYSHS